MEQRLVFSAGIFKDPRFCPCSVRSCVAWWELYFFLPLYFYLVGVSEFIFIFVYTTHLSYVPANTTQYIYTQIYKDNVQNDCTKDMTKALPFFFANPGCVIDTLGCSASSENLSHARNSRWTASGISIFIVVDWERRTVEKKKKKLAVVLVRRAFFTLSLGMHQTGTCCLRRARFCFPADSLRIPDVSGALGVLHGA